MASGSWGILGATARHSVAHAPTSHAVWGISKPYISTLFGELLRNPTSHTLCSLNYDALLLTRCGESPRRIVIVIVTTNCKVWVVLGSKRARSLNPSIPSTNHDVVLFDFDGGLVVWWSGRLVLSSWKGRGRAEDGRIGFSPVALPRRSATALEQFGFGPAWRIHFQE